MTACALRIQLPHTLNEGTFMATPDWDSARAQFPTLQKKIYLNSCSLGLLSRRSRDALNKYMDLWEEKGAAAWYVEWFAEMEDLREQFARLINASADEIAIMPSISASLAAISSSIDLQEVRFSDCRPRISRESKVRCRNHSRALRRPGHGQPGAVRASDFRAHAFGRHQQSLFHERVHPGHLDDMRCGP